jgi:Zn-dependent protease
MTTVLIVLVVVYSIILHEVAHGVVAYWNGDRTAKDAGRLTLNPLPHIDPIGTVALPLALFVMKAGVLLGWAKPVPFDPRNFRNRRFGIFTVGIAGPATNVILAVLFALLFRASGPYAPLTPVYFYGASANVFLALFNLIPATRRAYLRLEPWGFFIMILLIWTGLLQLVLGPIYERIIVTLTGLG